MTEKILTEKASVKFSSLFISLPSLNNWNPFYRGFKGLFPAGFDEHLICFIRLEFEAQ